MNDTTITTERDRLYFAQERECLAALREMEIEAAQLADELSSRLDHFDELDEALVFEQTGGGITHAYAGKPVPWLQIRLGEARTVLASAARRLQEAARELELAAGTTSRSGRLDHISRGYQALAAEALHVVESFRPGCEQQQTDWPRVWAIRDGVQRLKDLQGVEFKAELAHDLCSFNRNREGLLALGMADYVAAEIDGDSALQRVLRELRSHVGADRG